MFNNTWLATKAPSSTSSEGERGKRILPKNIADSLCPKRSTVALLHGLPKANKANLNTRSILSSTRSYHYNHGCKKKLKPFSASEYSICFSKEIHNSVINEDDKLVFMTSKPSLLHVPLNETNNILVNKAFTMDCFNQTYDLDIQKDRHARLL